MKNRNPFFYDLESGTLPKGEFSEWSLSDLVGRREELKRRRNQQISGMMLRYIDYWGHDAWAIGMSRWWNGDSTQHPDLREPHIPQPEMPGGWKEDSVDCVIM